MSNTQRLTVTRTTEVVLTTDDSNVEPMVQLDVLGQRSITAVAREGIAEVTAARAELDGDAEPETGEFKAIDDVRKFVDGAVGDEVEGTALPGEIPVRLADQIPLDEAHARALTADDSAEVWTEPERTFEDYLK